MRVIDTHCHLNDPLFKDRIEKVIEEATSVGVAGFIVPSYNLQSLAETRLLADRFKTVYPAFGLHPWYIDKGIDINIIRDITLSSRAIAIGEIGLDFSDEVTTPKDLQVEFFLRQIELAIQIDLPVLIHCRKAHQDMLRLLAPYKGRLRGVMHSFSGNQALLSEFISYGFYISFSGAVTRHHAKKYHKSAINAPQERILFETDAPAISTQTVQASDVEPKHILEIVRFVAVLRDIDEEKMAEISTENANRLFGRVF